MAPAPPGKPTRLGRQDGPGEPVLQGRRVGLSAKDRPIRGGNLLFETDHAVIPFGKVSSGGFGPTLRAPVAMGYLPISHSRPGTELFAVVGDRRVAVSVTELPFVTHGYKR